MSTLDVEIMIPSEKRRCHRLEAPATPRIPRITRLMALAIKFQDMVDRGEVRDYADLAPGPRQPSQDHPDHELAEPRTRHPGGDHGAGSGDRPDHCCRKACQVSRQICPLAASKAGLEKG
jgi:hypothetical protein